MKTCRFSKYLFQQVIREVKPYRVEYSLDYVDEDYRFFLSLGEVCWIFHSIVSSLLEVRVEDIDDFIENRWGNRFSVARNSIVWLGCGPYLRGLPETRHRVKFMGMLGSIERLDGTLETLEQLLGVGLKPKRLYIYLERIGESADRLRRVLAQVEGLEELDLFYKFAKNETRDRSLSIRDLLFGPSAHLKTLRSFRLKEESRGQPNTLINHATELFEALAECKQLERLVIENDNFEEVVLPSEELFFWEALRFVKLHTRPIKYLDLNNRYSTALMQYYLSSEKIQVLRYEKRYRMKKIVVNETAIASNLLVPIRRPFYTFTMDLGCDRKTEGPIFGFPESDRKRSIQFYKSLNRVKLLNLNIKVDLKKESDRIYHHLKEIIKYNSTPQEITITGEVDPKYIERFVELSNLSKRNLTIVMNLSLSHGKDQPQPLIKTKKNKYPKQE